MKNFLKRHGYFTLLCLVLWLGIIKLISLEPPEEQVKTVVVIVLGVSVALFVGFLIIIPAFKLFILILSEIVKAISPRE